MKRQITDSISKSLTDLERREVKMKIFSKITFLFVYYLFIIFRLVTAVGDAYGVALLLHMLATTITLTLLAYQATKVFWTL